MPKRKTAIPLAAAERIIRNASKKYGVDRISGKAVAKAVDIIETVIKRIAEDASKLASHAGRVTISKEDIEMAKKAVLKE